MNNEEAELAEGRHVNVGRGGMKDQGGDPMGWCHRLCDEGWGMEGSVSF